MQSLTDTHSAILEQLDERFSRHMEVDWNDRLIGITGARGVGKTTFLLQHIKYQLSPEAKPLYTSLDDIYFSSNTLVDLADMWQKRGGTHLFLDEVHKYPNWSQELKNIYDRYRKLKVVFTGSSLLHIYKGKADLSRRAVMYPMKGLSFREFLQIETGETFSKYSLEELLENHLEIARGVLKKVKPLAYFDKYLTHGYYPFYLESKTTYHRKLMGTIMLMLEVDLPYMRHVEVKYIYKIKKMLSYIAHAVPFQPNVSKLAADLEVSRHTVMLYLNYLEESGILNLLHSPSSTDSHMAKPEKVYIHHPNLTYAITRQNPEIGTVRESFFYNQVNNMYPVQSSAHGDFLVDGLYTFEIGGKSKTRKQLKHAPEGYIAADNLEYGNDRTIPLWLFGFLY